MQSIEVGGAFFLTNLLKSTGYAVGNNLLLFLFLTVLLAIPMVFVEGWQVERSFEFFGVRQWASIDILSAITHVLSFSTLSGLVTFAVIAPVGQGEKGLAQVLRQAGQTLGYAFCVAVVSILALFVILEILAFAGTKVLRAFDLPTLVVGLPVVTLIFLVITVLIATFGLVIPVAVRERKLPLSALRRSAQLTKGHRLKFCGLVLFFFLVDSIIEWCLEWILGETPKAYSFSDPHNWGSWAVFSFAAITAAVAYRMLQGGKEAEERTSAAAAAQDSDSNAS